MIDATDVTPPFRPPSRGETGSSSSSSSSKLLTTPQTPIRRAPSETGASPKDEFARSEEPGNVQQPQPQPPAQPPQESGRPMTAEEKADFALWFPKLDVEQSRVTAEATPQYNCISWTTGNTESWDWPPAMYPEVDDRQAFVQYYTERGFSPVSNEEAAAIGKDKELVAYWEGEDGPTHGSVAGPTHGDRWESKCGQAARITHGEQELVSEVYGHIAGYWLKTGEGAPPLEKLTREIQDRLKTKIEARVNLVSPELRKRFDEAYQQWQSHRKSPKVSMSSNPKAYCQGEGYNKLLKLGNEAIPLLVDKMHNGDFFCQYAVEELSKKKRDGFHIMGVSHPPALRPAEVRCSEQEKAQQIMVQWLESSW